MLNTAPAAPQPREDEWSHSARGFRPPKVLRLQRGVSESPQAHSGRGRIGTTVPGSESAPRLDDVSLVGGRGPAGMLGSRAATCSAAASVVLR